jgi:hypothetical protein
MDALCRSVEEVPAEGLEPAERQRRIAAWIGEHVTNEGARELFEAIGASPPKQRKSLMLAAAAKAGITHCAIAEDQ